MAEEVEEICTEVMSQAKGMTFKTDKLLFPRVKLLAECFQYQYELKPDDEQLRKKVDMLQKKALSHAKDYPPTHPERLEVALERCQFLRDKDPQEALRLAKSTFDEAIQNLDSLADESYQETTLVMQQLRDTTKAWEEEEREKEREEEEARRREEEKVREAAKKEEEKKRRRQELKR